MTTATQVATLSQLRAPQPPETRLPQVRAGFFDLQGFELIQRVAKAFASSTLVPTAYQGNMANCMIALNVAERIGADPLLTMQNLYIVHGRPGWSAQFLIASFNHCGRFTAIRYEWFGDKGKDSWGCRAYATEKDTGEKIVGPDITIALAKAEGWYEKSGSKWKTIPQLMLMYRAAAWLIRSHAPEISMGLQTADELADTYDAERSSDGTFSVTAESLQQKVDHATGEISAPDAEIGTVTYAQAMEAINACTSDEQCDVAADLLPGIAGGQQRAECDVALRAKRKALS